MNASLSLHFSPLLPEPILIAFVATCALLLILSAFFYRNGVLWRTLCIAAFLLVFLNPSIIQEERKPSRDVAAIVIDRSPSQNFGQRAARTDKAYAWLEKELKNFKNLDVRIIEAPVTQEKTGNETKLFEPLEQILNDVPQQQRAGVILITDGQVHDIPRTENQQKNYGPIQVLLTGDKDERDRRIEILEAPAYGIVGEQVQVRYRIIDTPNSHKEFAGISTSINDENQTMTLVPVDEIQTLNVTISHAGQNIVDLQTAPLDNEITQANNRVPLIINGVRDRLRVLLVSGQPHAGGRTWRNMLTADPGVDLVHFTILREPNKLDATPQNELSLIAFPFRELFEIKLYDFDLIIFDRYRLNRILPNFYFANIANYVKKGGALLEVSGPSFAGEDSVYTTALKDVLPAYPTGQVFERSYKPKIAELGTRHPVTQDLQWTNIKDDSKIWGSWLRQIAVQPTQGNILMTGANNTPLLILDRVDEGRVAQLASDQIWLWARGFEGGGPQAELMRRLAHWLMKEPELEETALNVHSNGNNIIITRRALQDIPITATLTTPDGIEHTIELSPDGEGKLQGRFKGEQLGIYTVDDGLQKRFTIIGMLNPPELDDVITTENRLKPIVHQTNGSFHWIEEKNYPALRLLPPGRNYGGTNWIGLRENNSHTVVGVTDHPFLPSWLYATILLILLLTAWWFEGRNPKKS